MKAASVARKSLLEGVVGDAIAGFNALEAVKGEAKKIEGGIWMAEQFLIAMRNRGFGSKEAAEACEEIIKTLKPV